MENWRLSKIEEELGKLNLDSSAHGATAVQSSEDSHANTPREQDDDDVKIVIRPAYKKASRSRHHDAVHTAAAVRRIKEKYDSPGAVTKVDCAAEKSTLNEGRSASHQPTWERPVEDDSTRTTSQVDHQTAQGPNVLCAGYNITGENLAESVERFTSSALQVRAIPDFPLIREHKSDDMLRQNGTRAGIRPSTAAKPLYSSFRGLIVPNSNEHSNNLSQVDSKDHVLPDSTDSSYSLPLMNFPVFQPPPFVESSRSSTIYLQDNLPPVPHDQFFSSDIFPAPPPDFFSQGVGLEMAPAAQKCQPEIICTSQARGGYSSASNVTYAAALHKGEDLVVNANSLSSQRIYGSTPQNSGEAKQQCEFVPAETQAFEHPASSHSDCYPRYGTLKATRHNPNCPTSGSKCDFSPPVGLGLTDEDRGQVELFYRSHKTKVFAARCQANLYFGSARRHSSILPSGGPRTAAAESPDNWVFVKTGIPVLVLDTGESRRQRRLHVILAERGPGFVLWRDTVDHLTTYSPSAETAFHTMHLSKDHTKLAGLYFADPVHAGDFFDYLNGFTSDPDDPLLNLSLGSKRRKTDRKMSTKRKEKRRPIKREDISMPCCFNHVTKLDRADGLNLLESDQTSGSCLACIEKKNFPSGV